MEKEDRMAPLLFLGSVDAALGVLVERLRAQGFWSVAPPSRFDTQLEAAVKHFQESHLGPDGVFLQVDGVVGERTWWALDNPSGAAQRSAILPSIPAGLGPKRTRILQVALDEHARGVAEDPDGSNRGPLLDKYLPEWARTGARGPAWCCYFYSWVVKEALSVYPLGVPEGSCAKARVRAVRRGLWTPKTVRRDRPLPGDAFVFDHGGGHGHIGFVLRVSADGSQINTVEGNAGNRVKVGLRDLSEAALVGFIDNVPTESSTTFERGLSSLPRLAGETTR